jgi:4-amino-4-deoxychorismate lyase
MSSDYIPILTSEDVIAAMRTLRMNQRVNFWAFYSSQLGGIVTDPALMVLPFDDHMVHRGHGVFDTAGLVDGRIYDLDAHLDRFIASAGRAKLALPFPRERMREIIIETTARAGHSDGAIRYWLSSGPGSLELTPAKGAAPGFFVMVFAGLVYPEHWYTSGLKVMTTTYPIKPSLYAITKTTNYLPNVLMQMEAKEKGLDNGVFIDAQGNVGESSNMNVAFVTEDNVLRHPTFDHILSGCTSQRLLALAPALVAQGLIAGVEVCEIPVADARAAKEMLLIGSSIKVAPIVEWDGAPIGTGTPGPVAKALLALLEQDMTTNTDRLIVPTV